MKCTNRWCCFILTFSILVLSGCSGQKFDYSYNEASVLSGFTVYDAVTGSRNTGFADALPVTNDNFDNGLGSRLEENGSFGSGLLFDLKNKNVLFSRNVHERMNPASLTKIMTALVALENGSLDTVLTATSNTLVDVSGTQVCGLKSGDKMTLEQALNVMLVYSANDAALLIAEGIGGNIANFVDMMNQKARALGATNTHFANPHGLTDEEHYTTAYDLYLLFNEAIKQPKFTEIIQKSSYSTTYTDKNNKNRELSVSNTNRFLTGKAKAPENVTIIGGKTGNTKAAGSCLILYVKDIEGNSYISEILNSESSDCVYLQMAAMLETIRK